MTKYSTTVLYVDCTTLLNQNFISGIQRILIDFAEGNDRVIPVVWNSKATSYSSLIRFPKRKRIYRTKTNAVLVLIALAPLLTIGKKLFLKHKNLIFKSNTLRTFSHYLYGRVYAKETFESYTQLISQSHLIMNTDDVLIILDIPTNPIYLKFLEKNYSKLICKKIVYFHDLIPIQFPEFWSTKQHSKIKKQYMKYLQIIFCSDQIIANSEYTKRELIAYLIESRHYLVDKFKDSINVVYPCSGLLIEKLLSNNRTSPYKNVNDSSFNLIFVGNLDERKNLKVVIKALMLLANDSPKVLLHIVSPMRIDESAEVSALIRYAEENDLLRFKFYDHLTDQEISSLYKVCDLLLIPSRAEGFGIPVIEALGFNCDVIVAKNTALSELAELFDLRTVAKDSPRAWANELLHYFAGHSTVTSPRKDMSEFSPEAFRKRLIKAI